MVVDDLLETPIGFVCLDLGEETMRSDHTPTHTVFSLVARSQSLPPAGNAADSAHGSRVMEEV